MAQCPQSIQGRAKEAILSVIKGSIQRARTEEASEYRVTAVAAVRPRAEAPYGQPLQVPVESDKQPLTSSHGTAASSPPFYVEATAEPLPSPPKPPISVQVETGIRHDPTVKGTAWVATRRPWEQAMRADCEEVLLADAAGRLHEGLSSNLMVLLADGVTLRGAPRGSILQGSILQVITAEVAPALGLCVQEAFPLVSELSSYRALFICSTSRLLLPVDHVYHGAGDATFDYDSSRDPILAEMQRRLQQALLVRATKLI